jgi:PAS domain-containing protein
MTDVGASAEQNNSLETSEDTFRLLVESVRDYAIFMLDTKGRIQTWNAGARLIKATKPMK